MAGVGARRRDVAWCLALSLTAAVLRIGALAPSSLWRDDAWQALVVRAESWTDVARIGQTAPGFAVLLSLWLALAGLSSMAAQALPFLAGVTGAPFAYLLARRVGLATAGAVAAGIILAIAPVHATYSTRVKPFTLDADVSMLLLFLAVRGIEQPARRRRWAALLLAGVLATVLSASTLPVTLAATVAVTGAALSRHPRRPVLAAASLAGIVVFALFWRAWWLRQRLNEPLMEFWAYSLVPLDGGIGAAAEAAWSGTERLLEALSPLPVWLTAALAALGAIVLAGRAPWLAALCLGGPAIALAAAAMHLAPYGGGRTDIYLCPSLALLLAAPVDAVSRLLSARARLIGLVLAIAPLATARPGDPYPAEDIRPIVGIVESQATAGDAVIVYPQDGYIYALYSHSHVRIVDSDLSLTGFTVALDHPGITTLILAPHWDDPYSKQYERGIRESSTAIRALLAGRPDPGRIWFVARSDGRAVATFESILREAGLTLRQAWNLPGADLTLWTTGRSGVVSARRGRSAPGRARLPCPAGSHRDRVRDPPERHGVSA